MRQELGMSNGKILLVPPRLRQLLHAVYKSLVNSNRVEVILWVAVDRQEKVIVLCLLHGVGP